MPHPLNFLCDTWWLGREQPASNKPFRCLQYGPDEPSFDREYGSDNVRRE